MIKLFLILLFIPIFSFAQKPSLRVGLQLLKSAHIELDFAITDHNTIGTRISRYFNIHEGDYRINTGLFSVSENFKWWNQEGFGYGLHYGFKAKNNDKIWLLFQVEYRNMKSGKYIDDAGYGGGSNHLPYSEYTEEFHDLSLSFKPRVYFFKNNRIEFISEIGFYYGIGKRYYSVTGSYAVQLESDKIEQISRSSPFIRAGFNFRIF